jgi:hypothetical protein
MPVEACGGKTIPSCIRIYFNMLHILHNIFISYCIHIHEEGAGLSHIHAYLNIYFCIVFLASTILILRLISGGQVGK